MDTKCLHHHQFSTNTLLFLQNCKISWPRIGKGTHPIASDNLWRWSSAWHCQNSIRGHPGSSDSHCDKIMKFIILQNPHNSNSYPTSERINCRRFFSIFFSVFGKGHEIPCFLFYHQGWEWAWARETGALMTAGDPPVGTIHSTLRIIPEAVPTWIPLTETFVVKLKIISQSFEEKSRKQCFHKWLNPCVQNF